MTSLLYWKLEKLSSILLIFVSGKTYKWNMGYKLIQKNQNKKISKTTIKYDLVVLKYSYFFLYLSYFFTFWLNRDELFAFQEKFTSIIIMKSANISPQEKETKIISRVSIFDAVIPNHHLLVWVSKKHEIMLKTVITQHSYILRLNLKTSSLNMPLHFSDKHYFSSKLSSHINKKQY